MEKKSKRYYKVGEIVWVIGDKKRGKVVAINKENLEVTVSVEGETVGNTGASVFVEKILKVWEIDKLKYRAKDELVKRKSKKVNAKSFAGEYIPTVYFAKVKEDAVIPSKRDEDAGYDIYANIPPTDKAVLFDEVPAFKTVREIICPKGETTLVPTGIAVALPKTHYLNCKHERGSTAKLSISVLAGVVDSGYRGEIFIAINPLHMDLVITDEVSEVTYSTRTVKRLTKEVVLYPYGKAIAQATIELVPKVNIKEVSFEELQKMESERGDSKLGASGK